MATEAFVTPRIVAWARERAGLSPDAAAKRLGVRAATLVQWENGDARPTMKQAEHLARKLSIPLGYLYLSRPPSEDLPLPDLRTIAGAPPRQPSPDFLSVLDDALRKQQWYREYLEMENSAPLEFIGKFKPGDPITDIAIDISNLLHIDDHLRDQSVSWEQFLTEFIRSVERLGVLVLRSGIVGGNTYRRLNVNEFRGFVVSDPIAPLVFINSRDAKSAQSFPFPNIPVTRLTDHCWCTAAPA